MHHCLRLDGRPCTNRLFSKLLSNDDLIHPLPHTSLLITTPNTIHHIRPTVRLYDFPDLYSQPIDFISVKASVNKLIPATSLGIPVTSRLWALYKSRVYNYNYNSTVYSNQ